MINLRRLGAAVVLTLGLTLVASADCPDPGIMNGPPCASLAQTTPNDLTEPEQQTETSTVSESTPVDLFSLAETALNALMLF
jgi:hypothetical protein